MLWSIADVDWSLRPIKIQRVKRQLLHHNPLHQRITRQIHNPKITRRPQPRAVVLPVPIHLMSHVLVQIRVHPAMLHPRRRIFLHQRSLQIC